MYVYVRLYVDKYFFIQNKHKCVYIRLCKCRMRNNETYQQRSTVYDEMNKQRVLMMTSSNENIFRVTGHLCGEFTGQRWIPRTKARDAELWCFLWSAPE